MRIRQVKPAFWTDPIMARLTYAARLFYIGLWNVADDAGWIEWEPVAIGAVLFPYEAPKRRDRLMGEWAGELVAADRLTLHECGCGVIPTLPGHQRVSGQQSFTARDRHLRDHASGLGTQPKEYKLSPDQLLQAELLDRDGLSCRLCGNDVTRATLVLAHINPAAPRSLGNLVVACRRCNYKQGPQTVEEAGMTLIPVPLAPKRYDPLSHSPGRKVVEVVGKGKGGAGGMPIKINDDGKFEATV